MARDRKEQFARAARAKLLRTTMKLRQVYFEKVFNVSQGQYSRMESGFSWISDENMAIIEAHYKGWLRAELEHLKERSEYLKSLQP